MDRIKLIMTFIRLLGRPGILHQEDWLEPPSGKTAALLYYLAYQDDWVNREDLLFLFWPDTLEEKARSNLRQLLSSIRKLPYAASLESSKTKLRWEVATDIASLKEAIQKQQWQEVIKHYQGNLIELPLGQHIPEFESWLELEREHLFELYKDAVLRLVDDLELQEKHVSAAEYVKHIYDQDPLDDEVFRRYLQLLALSGQATKLSRAFEKHKAYLADELAVDVDEELVAFFEYLDSEAFHSEQRQSTFFSHVAKLKTKALPVASTSFIGREKELLEIKKLLLDRGCRLLSVVASGGMGKTRLALEAARQLQPSVQDGVAFVALENVTTGEGIISELVSALQFELSPSADPKSQVLDYLAAKHSLVVFDNCEHLLNDLRLIPELLSACEHLKILCTTREHLNLKAEWLFDLEGLDIVSHDVLEASDAVQLFIQSAKRAQPYFQFSEAHQVIKEICHKVEGMPLALELAASWLRVLSLEAILEELTESLDALTADIRDLPDRHQSIRSIYESSWLKLNAREQDALLKLAVFQGGFRLDAAKEVTGISTPLLLALVNKSFVRKEGDRFTQHPLIWQFLREKLVKADPEELFDKHALYYAQLAAHFDPPFVGLNHKEILQTMTLELRNLVSAWERAAKQRNEELLALLCNSMKEFFFHSERIDEGIKVFETAEVIINFETVVSADIACALGQLNNMADKTDKAIGYFQEAIRISEPLNAFATLGRAKLYKTIADPKEPYSREKAEADFKEALLYFEKANDHFHQCRTIANLVLHLKSVKEKEYYFEQMLKHFAAGKSELGLSRGLNNYAFLFAEHYGDYDKALELVLKAIKNEQIFSRRYRLASLQTSLAEIYLLKGNLEAAKTAARNSQALGKNLALVFFKWAAVFNYAVLIEVALLESNVEEAQKQLELVLNVNKGEVRPQLANQLIWNQEANIALYNKDYAAVKTSIQRVFDVDGDEEPLHCFSYCLLGFASIRLGEQGDALRYAQKALVLAQEFECKPYILLSMLVYAEVLLFQGNTEDAMKLLWMIHGNNASSFATKHLAEEVLQIHAKLKDLEKVTFEEGLKLISAISVKDY